MYESHFLMKPWAMHDMAGVDIMHSILQDSGPRDANLAPYFNVLYQVAEAAVVKKQVQDSGIYEEGEPETNP